MYINAPWKTGQKQHEGDMWPALYDVDGALLALVNFEHLMPLLQAAPELLEACEQKLPCTLSNTCFADDLDTIANVIDEIGYDATAKDLREKAQKIRLAIAKAKGEAP